MIDETARPTLGVIVTVHPRKTYRHVNPIGFRSAVYRLTVARGNVDLAWETFVFINFCRLLQFSLLYGMCSAHWGLGEKDIDGSKPGVPLVAWSA